MVSDYKLYKCKTSRLQISKKEGQLNYIQYGEGKDIIFLHGWGGSTDSFLAVAKRFSPRFRVTLVDFAGFGKTAEPTRPMTVADYANDVLGLMQELNIKKATLVGHSFGGRVAIEIAAKHGHLVDKIVLVDSAGLKPRRSISYYFKVAVHKLRLKLGLKGLKGSKDYSKLSPVMKQTFKNIVNYNQKPLLSHINGGTAIFWGKNDKETKPYMARVFHRRISGSALFWLDGGHFAYLEDGRAFMAILSAFLS